MHDSKLGAQTWLLGLFLIVANPKGRSSVQLAADLGITQKSAWHVSHRVRRAWADGCLPGFDGPIQVDEAWFGGKAKNRHRRAVDPGKTPVIVVVDNATGEAVEEHNFRFNNRCRHVTDRMADAAARMSGRRLPWSELVADGPHAQRQAA